MKKVIGIALAFTLVVTPVLSAKASATTDAYDPLRTTTGGPGNVVEYIVENGNAERNAYVAIMPGDVNSTSAVRTWQWCTGLNDPICDPKNNPVGLKTTSILPPCTTSTQENCLVSLEIGTGQNLTKASLIRVASGLTFNPDQKYNYIGSSNISLWSIPLSQANGGATTFAVMPRVQENFRNGTLHQDEFFADVTPYREEKDAKYQQININTASGVTAENRYSYSQYSQICVYEEDGTCGVAQDFSPNTRIRMTIRLSKEVGGWFQGRLKDPVMSVENFSANNSLLIVEASAVSVPRMATVVSRASMSDFEKIEYQNMGYWPTTDNGNGSGAQANSTPNVFNFLEYYRGKVKDTAAGVNTFWNFSTTSSGSGSSCLSDKTKLLGLVTTNSMAYYSNAPDFQDGALSYHVAGLHYMPDGVTPNQGTYNLVMRSDIARCLYGLSPAPVKATISISGGTDAVVATTSQGESNGWLSLSASGFTFSQKNIQVKLTQDTPPTTAGPNASKTFVNRFINNSKTTKITITCVKGKIASKVTAVKPVCPKGYVKK